MKSGIAYQIVSDQSHSPGFVDAPARLHLFITRDEKIVYAEKDCEKNKTGLVDHIQALANNVDPDHFSNCVDNPAEFYATFLKETQTWQVIASAGRSESLKKNDGSWVYN